MEEMIDPEDLLQVKPVNFFANRPISFSSEFYLSGLLETPDKYTEWFDTIRNAGKNDLILIRINSEGGDLFTAIQFLSAMKDCQGTIVASVEGSCVSAATLIFLHADEYSISDHSFFMFHNYSGGTQGKGAEMYDQIKYEKQWSKKLFKDSYSNFLTKKEIKKILNNKDIWLSGDEVIQRLQKRNEILN